MDFPVNVPVDNPNADTEWNDILRKHKIIPEKPPSPTPYLEEALADARRLAQEHRLEGKGLDELDELEDDEDDAFLEIYRQKRLAELSTLQKKSKHGRVYPISKPEYSSGVTEASKDGNIILVLLTSSAGGNVESRLLNELWRRIAEKYPEIKFCEMRADMAIEGYPEKNCPTVLVYQDEQILRQIVTLRELGGVNTQLEDLERFLVEIKAIGPTDQRLRRREEDEDGDGDATFRGAKGSNRIQGKQNRQEDSDDEWA